MTSLVFDTTALSHFARAGHTDELRIAVADDEPVLLAEVAAEPARGVPGYPVLGSAAAEGWLKQAELDRYLIGRRVPCTVRMVPTLARVRSWGRHLLMTRPSRPSPGTASRASGRSSAHGRSRSRPPRSTPSWPGPARWPRSPAAPVTGRLRRGFLPVAGDTADRATGPAFAGARGRRGADGHPAAALLPRSRPGERARDRPAHPLAPGPAVLQRGRPRRQRLDRGGPGPRGRQPGAGGRHPPPPGFPYRSRRRILSLRYLAADARHAPRPWRTSPPFDGLQAELPAGAAMDHPLFPVIWPP